jgi:hypothetical protein
MITLSFGSHLNPTSTGEGGQIMPTLYCLLTWCPHQVLKSTSAPARYPYFIRIGLETQETHTQFKVQLFWEGHKNVHNRPYGFDIYLANMRTILQILVAFSEKLNFINQFCACNKGFSNTTSKIELQSRSSISIHLKVDGWSLLYLWT